MSATKKVLFPGTLRGKRWPIGGSASIRAPAKKTSFLLPCLDLILSGKPLLATQRELSEFLKGVERRAYKQAYFAVRNEEWALDIVQDAMLKLAEKYAANPNEELPLLFQRILQNTIRDHYRRQKVRSTWVSLISALTPGHEEEEIDPMETLQASDGSNKQDTPHELVDRMQTIDLIERSLADLPPRQRQAFVLRYWEELDVSETAQIMGCSEGSVKTHCSRATHALAAALKAKGIGS